MGKYMKLDCFVNPQHVNVTLKKQMFKGYVTKLCMFFKIWR